MRDGDRARGRRRGRAPTRRGCARSSATTRGWTSLLLGLGPDAHTRVAVPRRARGAGAPAARRRRAGAGMEPQVPRVTLTFPALNSARARSSSSCRAPTRRRRSGARSATRRIRRAGRARAPGRRRRSSSSSTRPRRRSSTVSEAASSASTSAGRRSPTAVLAGRRVSSSPIAEPTRRRRRDALVDQLTAEIERHRGGGRAGGRHRPAVDHRVRDGPRPPHASTCRCDDVPLRELLTERCGVPVYVDNDAVVRGARRGVRGRPVVVAQNLVMLTIGTGVGGGMVLGGKRLPRRDDVGGRARPHDHRPRPDRGRARRSGRLPPARLAGAAGLRPRAGPARRRVGARAPEVLPRPAARGGRARSPGTTRSRARSRATMPLPPRDPRPRRAARDRHRQRDQHFDPDEIVIGGGVSARGELLLKPAERTAASPHGARHGRADHVRLARHGPQAGVLGAATMAAQEYILERTKEPV